MLNSPFSSNKQQELEPLFFRRLLRKLEELHESLMLLSNKTWSQSLAAELEQKAQGLYKQIQFLGDQTALDLDIQLNGRLKQLTSEEEQASPNIVQRIIQSLETILERVKTVGQHTEQQLIPEHLILILSDREDDSLQMTEQLRYFGFDASAFNELESLKIAIPALQPSALLVQLSFAGLNKGEDEPPLSLPDFLGASLPMVFVSDKGDLASRLFAVRAGAHAFFYGQLEYQELVEALDNLLTTSDQSPFRILIVDDSKTQSSFLNATLHKAVMTTKVINDPLSITEALIEFRPELILLDLYMPGCSGQELASVIRQQGAYVSVPIVFLSAESDNLKQRNAMALGGDDFLTKPVDPAALIASVKNRTLRSRALKTQMVRDSLTGLLKHSRVLEQLDLEISRALRHGTNLCFAMLDIDHFKQVNDNYGHPTGDRVIKILARLLSQRLRKSDTIGRYGGEEFAIIFPQTDPETVLNILNEIRENFGKIAHRHEDGDFFVKLSGGLAFINLKTNTLDGLCKAADDALYEAKRSGRNKIVSTFKGP
jgi:diguanylate cyclase (GGDEF)-like protein